MADPEKNWIRQHADTIVLMGAIGTSFLWMNGKFNGIENRLTRIETVLIMKNIMPMELASCKKDEEKKS